ncbi:uncharacterized protein N7515_004613 [Penicillium bovifimosum]|uniref:F-box domain-containing protein n=1 Tax=Penicillium bovifimosum TaxID=126998 RepID=A0A9W9H0S4_9EURO|nr:uncharacterized protein N7515_004613 [Penicillium bovifimosum]KAJ5135335.1 hypothetical protein N7515_004613 [Penicillium bovifimosum]
MAYAPALPLELWGCIESHLSNADIKSLRLTCKQLSNIVFLRFNRVFLSANPLNIEVFRNIASHDKYRYQVNEIIWDEARLRRGPPRRTQFDEVHPHELLSDEENDDNPYEWAGIYGKHPTRYTKEMTERHGYEEEHACPKWFRNACEENLFVMQWREDHNVDRPDHIARREQVLAQPWLGERWQYYQQLLRQQEDVLASQSDLEAFTFGIKQFPALKRVTITPSAHGHLISPLYQTPMIRAFPKGFNYPIPRGWLYARTVRWPAAAYSWNQYPELRDRYRGFRTAMRVLANEPNSVSELVMTSNGILTGINCRIFDEPCEEYDHFATVLKKPGFRRLDIALLAGGLYDEDLEACWRSLLGGRLRRALGEAKDMEEFRLHTPFDEFLNDNGGYPLLPLRDIVPVEQWSKLRHLNSPALLSHRRITLPKSVRSIELSMLHFRFDDEDWFSMLEEIKEMVSEGTLWGDRDAGSRPKITIGMAEHPLVDVTPSTYGYGVWIEKEVEDFIYGEGENPIGEHRPWEIQLGVGVLRNTLDPGFEHPHNRFLTVEVYRW